MVQLKVTHRNGVTDHTYMYINQVAMQNAETSNIDDTIYKPEGPCNIASSLYILTLYGNGTWIYNRVVLNG